MATLPAKPTNRPVAPKQQPPPIQRVNFTEEDFKGNISRLNTIMAQLTGAVQALQGSGGRTSLFSGLDVQGETISGVGAPQSPTDAVSLQHADSSYSPAATASSFDLGGANALKGLSNIQLQLQQAANGTVTLAKITGGGSNGSLTFVNGLITKFVAPS